MNTPANAWREATKREPCPICSKHDWCSLTGPEGNPGAAVCMRVESANRRGNGGWLHQFHANGRESIPATYNGRSEKRPDFATSADAIAATERTIGRRHDAKFTYRDAEGQPVGIVLRWDAAGDDEKQIRPLAKVGEGWTIGAMSQPRPLYGLPDILTAPDVLIVEGERCADEARTIGIVATTWAGGAKAIGQTSWAPLAGKKVTIWPDNDAPGREAADAIAAKLLALSPPAVVEFIEPPQWLPPKGDIVDFLDQHDAVEPEGLAELIATLPRRAPSATTAAELNGHSKVEIACGRPDARGQRLYVATLGDLTHRDKFDADSQWRRKQFREAVAARFGLNDDANDWLEREILKQADSCDDHEEAFWECQVQTVADMQRKPTHWFWDGRIPAGALTCIEGDPGLGKSQLTIDIAARATTGAQMPGCQHDFGQQREPRGVLMLNGEDDPERTIYPRLEAAGADLSRVHLLRTMTALDGKEERPVELPTDIPAIEQIIIARSIGLMTIDPWVSFLSGDLNMNCDADVRRCLSALAAMAERTGTAVVLVRHLNKKSGLNAMYRGGGSIGITGACRAVFVVGADPGDENSRVMAPVKMNLAPMPSSLRFTIEPHDGTSRVCWGELCTVSAADMLQGQQGGRGRGNKTDEAMAVIEDMLANGPRGSNEVMGACVSAGLSERTYHTARKAMGVVSEKTAFNGNWMLSLPKDAKRAEDDQF